MEIVGKTFFSGRIWPDWKSTAWVDMARLGKYSMGGYGQIGEIQHGRIWSDWGPQGHVCMLMHAYRIV